MPSAAGVVASRQLRWVVPCSCTVLIVSFLLHPSLLLPPRPEFLNRLDEIIVFRQLTKSEVKQIADIMLKQVFTRAEEKGIKIDVTGACGWVGRGRLDGWGRAGMPLGLPALCSGEHWGPALAGLLPRHNPPATPSSAAERFKDRLVDEGYNPAYGARPLRRAIMRLLEDSMAERMLAGDIKEGDSVIIDGEGPGLVCRCWAGHAGPGVLSALGGAAVGHA